MESPWAWIRVWTIRTVGKYTPTQEIFWADEYQLIKLRPEAKQIVGSFHVEAMGADTQ